MTWAGVLWMGACLSPRQAFLRPSDPLYGQECETRSQTSNTGTWVHEKATEKELVHDNERQTMEIYAVSRRAFYAGSMRGANAGSGLFQK